MEKSAIKFDGCDGALWYVHKNEEYSEIDSTVYKYEDRNINPSELGFKYHILTFKEDDESSVEVISAYVGDVRNFIDNHGKAGYNGLMVKDRIIPKKTIRQMFELILSRWNFSQKIIRTTIKAI